MDDVFFEDAEGRRQPNGYYVIVLQTLPVRGGNPLPVQVLHCREAGALKLMEVLAAMLRR